MLSYPGPMDASESARQYSAMMCFGLSKFIAFIMHLGITYIRYVAKVMNLEKLKYLIIWNKEEVRSNLEKVGQSRDHIFLQT